LESGFLLPASAGVTPAKAGAEMTSSRDRQLVNKIGIKSIKLTKEIDKGINAHGGWPIK
jgi:hypothetical protein